MTFLYFPARAVLFEEQQSASSLLILLEGYAKVSVNSREGRRLILWIGGPGELMGLTSVLRGHAHEVTAETVQPCRIASIRRQEFLDFLVRHPAVYQSVARELSVELGRACEQMRIMGLSSSAAVKLARLLLEWSLGGATSARGTRVNVSLTHEEMGECIGVTRETISRAMADLRERRLIRLHGSALIVTNRFALEAFAQGLRRAIPPEAASLANRAGGSRLPATHSREVTEINARRRLN